MIGRRSTSGKESSHPAHIEIVLLIAAVALLAIYTILRYGGLWGEVDTANFTKAIRSMLEGGRLVPDRDVYGNGYGFPMLAVFLIRVTGMSLPDLQLYGSALLAIWIVLPAWLLYREFTRSNRGATLATVILFIQPEFLFPILRGTHEKFTRGLMLLCLYLLFRSLRSRGRLSRFIGFVLSFYLAAYAMITFNNLIATSFIVSVGLALALGWFISRGNHAISTTVRPTLQRLMYVSISLIIFAFVFTFYAYPPAMQQLRLLKTIGDQIAALFLPVERTATNPYAVVSGGWVGLPVYFMVSIANWILLAVSAVIWLSQGYKWWVRRQQPQEQMELLLWAFYGAIAVLVAISVIVDISGALSSNLQLRIFPSFVMIAAPLVARWVVNWKPQERWKTHLGYIALATSIGLLATLSTFKATNEPLLSNKWMFYLPAEMQAIHWAEVKMPGRQLWTDFDERLVTAYDIQSGAKVPGIQLEMYKSQLARDFLISDVTLSRSLRLSEPVPIASDSLITYDNGQVKIYQLLPMTPYQH